VKAAPETAAPLVPPRPTLVSLRAAAAECKACDLWKRGTQTVFGEGARRAAAMLVGEQPGNEEDLSGRPFVGPAGRLLDKALAEAGIPREQVYVTNAVKHFKFIWRGKKRLHQKPAIRYVTACRPWLEAEFETLQPAIVVCMGSTAAQSIFRKPVPIMKERGKFLQSELGPLAFITIHPSSIYRHPEKEEQEKEYRRFADEMKLLQRKLRTLKAA